MDFVCPPCNLCKTLSTFFLTNVCLNSQQWSRKKCVALLRILPSPFDHHLLAGFVRTCVSGTCGCLSSLLCPWILPETYGFVMSSYHRSNGLTPPCGLSLFSQLVLDLPSLRLEGFVSAVDSMSNFRFVC